MCCIFWGDLLFEMFGNFVPWFSLSVALQLYAADKVKSLSSGAPVLACRSMLPRHGSGPQKGYPPYAILVHPEEIFSNGSVRVTIASKEDTLFKGYLLMAKPTPYWQKSGQSPIGTFLITEGTARLNCPNGLNNAITHDYAQFMTEVSMEWRPPAHYKGKVTFIATVVKKYTEYWTGLFSKAVRIL